MWNYRIVRKREVHADPKSKKERTRFSYAIHEAYYDKNGKAGSITQESINPFGENIEELRHSWIMMAEAFGQPILDFDSIPEPGYSVLTGRRPRAYPAPPCRPERCRYSCAEDLWKW